MCRRLGRQNEPGQVIRTVQDLTLSLDCPVTLDGELYHPNETGLLHLQVTDPVPFVQLRPEKGA